MESGFHRCLQKRPEYTIKEAFKCMTFYSYCDLLSNPIFGDIDSQKSRPASMFDAAEAFSFSILSSVKCTFLQEFIHEERQLCDSNQSSTYAPTFWPCCV